MYALEYVWVLIFHFTKKEKKKWNEMRIQCVKMYRRKKLIKVNQTQRENAEQYNVEKNSNVFLAT